MMARNSSTPVKPTSAWRRQAATLRQSVHAWWKGRTPREHRLLSVGAVIVATALIWTVGLAPALNTIEQSRQLLPRLHADAAKVNALIVESQSLARSHTGRIKAGSMPDALRNSLARAGLAANAVVSDADADQHSTGWQWDIALSNADAVHVMEWLAGLPSLLQVQTQQVELARANVEGRDRPGQVTGLIRVRLPAEGKP